MMDQARAVLRFSWKLLSHQRAKTVAAVCAVAFAVCLAMVQIGLYTGARSSMSLVIDRSTADLWVVPRGARNFDYTQVLTEHDSYLLRSLSGVAVVEPVIVGNVNWKIPSGGIESVQVVGMELDGVLLHPWNIKSGDPGKLTSDRTVLMDQGDLKKLECPGLDSRVELSMLTHTGMEARVVGLTERVRNFQKIPILMTSLKNARAYRNIDEGGFTSLLVRVAKGHDPLLVKRTIERSLDRVEACPRAEFAYRCRNYWDTKTGVGAILFASAFLGVVIGVGTVMMIQYIATLDHLREYATLKALGVPNSRIIAIVLAQSLLIGVLGYLLGLTLALIAQERMERRLLVVLFFPALYGGVFLGTIGFCAAASLLPALKIIGTEPEVVFRT